MSMGKNDNYKYIDFIFGNYEKKKIGFFHVPMAGIGQASKITKGFWVLSFTFNTKLLMIEIIHGI